MPNSLLRRQPVIRVVRKKLLQQLVSLLAPDPGLAPISEAIIEMVEALHVVIFGHVDDTWPVPRFVGCAEDFKDLDELVALERRHRGVFLASTSTSCCSSVIVVVVIAVASSVVLDLGFLAFEYRSKAGEFGEDAAYGPAIDSAGIMSRSEE